MSAVPDPGPGRGPELRDASCQENVSANCRNQTLPDWAITDYAKTGASIVRSPSPETHWRDAPMRLAAVAADMMRLGRERGADRRPVMLAIDGRSSGGETTLAERLRAAVAGSAVVHTDDIAWWYSRFGWAELLISGVLVPARSGRAVSYRPPP